MKHHEQPKSTSAFRKSYPCVHGEKPHHQSRSRQKVRRYNNGSGEVSSAAISAVSCFVEFLRGATARFSGRSTGEISG